MISADDGLKIGEFLLKAFGPVGFLTLAYSVWVTIKNERLTSQLIGNLPAEVAAKTSLDQTLTRVIAVMDRVTQQLDRKT